MNRWLVAGVVAVGLSLVVAPQAAWANGLEEAKAAVADSTDRALVGLDEALGHVPDDDIAAQAAITNAIEKMESGKQRALDALEAAEQGLVPDEYGLSEAVEATSTHQDILEDVKARLQGMDAAPEAIKAVDHAIDVSLHGHNTVKAIKEGARGQDIPRPDFGERPGTFSEPSDVSPPRGLSQPPRPTAPSSPRSSDSPRGGFRPGR